MRHAAQIGVPAIYYRGGTSKGVFFKVEDLPAAAREPGPARDALLQRVIGSPDPYANHIDGMGGASSSTSKTVLLSASDSPDHDVDYLFGQVAIDKAFVDWSGNCGNLSAAVGPAAIRMGLLPAERCVHDGRVAVRIRQCNIDKTIVAHVPMCDGEPQETGDFELDGVTFPSAEVRLDFLDPGDRSGALFPTGQLIDELQVPGVGTFPATLINAGIPTIFLNAADLGYEGTELRPAINGDASALARFETIRAHGALKMGLIESLDEAATRQHTPKVAFVAPPVAHRVSSGREVMPDDVDLLARALSMGLLHHAMMGTAAVALGTAAAIPGTLVNKAAGGGARDSVRFGHPSGTLEVGASARSQNGVWQVERVSMSRSARRLMQGEVLVPGDSF